MSSRELAPKHGDWNTHSADRGETAITSACHCGLLSMPMLLQLRGLLHDYPKLSSLKIRKSLSLC
jgi:hypothetical protein